MTIYNVSASVVSDGVTLDQFDEMNVLSGGLANGVAVGAEADLYVQNGAVASNTVVASGGGAFVTGTADDGAVNAGGLEYVLGGIVNYSEIGSGGIERLADGGVGFATQLHDGGVQQAMAGATVYDTMVSGGAAQFVSSGATATGTMVQSGGFQEVLSGGAVTSTTVQSGGTQVVLPGAAVISTLLQPGGQIVSTGIVYNPYPPAVVLLGDAVAGLAVGGSASDYVLAGGVANGTTVSSGGVQYVDIGGAASGTALRAGGIETVSGGTASATTVSGGGAGVYSLQNVGTGGVARATQVFGGGAQNVSGGTADNTVLSGGAQFAETGGLVSAASVGAGGYQFIGAGGVASGTTVSKGGSENVSGGTAYDTVVSSGGQVYVAFGGVLSGVTLSGDGRLGPGGTISAATLGGGAVLTLAGGTAYGSEIGDGGLQLLSGNATYATAVSEAFDSTIGDGGVEVVAGRGAEIDPTIAGGGLVLAGGVVSGGIDFATSGGKLLIDEAVPDNVISGFTVADAIDLEQVNFTSGATVNVTGPNQVVISAGGAAYTLNIAGAQLSAPHFQVSGSSDGTVLLTETAPCFAAGTHILTPGGEVAVERLRPGDLVITIDGADAPVIWIGRRRLDLARHVRPASVQPIRIAADSFGEGVPSRDLMVSPDHALFVEGVLVPAKALLNGRNIQQLARPAVTYFHVELARHSVIFADGMAVESYLETGNRGAFENGEAALILHPDFAQTMREARSCAPFTETGLVVEAVARRLLERHYAAVAAPRRSLYL